MLTITITDTNTERYTYTASANILGRRYDNVAEYVSVVKPESESGRDCIMIVTYGDTVVDHIPVGDTPIAITSNLSQYAIVKIGFAFLGADGYIKNSEVKQFCFLPAQKPDGFVPLPPVQKTTVEYLLSHGFTGAKLENNILSFTNAAGEAVAEIKLSGFIQEQADWKQTDPTAETYIKNKPTKLSEFTNDSGFVTGEAISGKADKSYVDAELGKKQPTGDYALKSELPDVSQFITKTVNDLVYYYTKTQVDNMVSAIPKFSIQVVDALPYENISITTVYLLRNDGDAGNLYTEYIYVDGAWEPLGTQTVDLSGYVTTEALNSAIADFVTAEYVSRALANYATTDSLNAHTGNTNNPHGVTAEQTGAYVKPESGIPETDLSAEVQNKLNAGGAEKNLLQGEVNITVLNEAEANAVEIDYALNAVVGKSYNVIVSFDNEEKSFLCKGVDFEGAIAIGSVGNDFSPYILLKENTGLLIADKRDENFEIADNKSAILLSHLRGSGDFLAVVKSITEVEEVVADKVKNPLKITVNGEQKTYDGSKAVDVSINTTTDKNILKSDVTFTEVGGGLGYSILVYALNLEVGKAYKLKWDISGKQYSQTTYCWLKNEQIQLGTADSGGGGESIRLIPNDPESGVMWIVDKYYANPATEETAPSENNASIVVTGYASTLKLISIEDAGVYIPVPTTADVGKILKVSAYGHYELGEP